MCLVLRKFRSDKPYYTKSKYRYKSLFSGSNDTFYSQYVRSNIWTIGEWKTAKTHDQRYGDFHAYSPDDKDRGFHVYISRKDCIGHSFITYGFGVFEVDQFNSSGIAKFESDKSETWGKARLIAFYSYVLGEFVLTNSIPSYTGPKKIKIKWDRL